MKVKISRTVDIAELPAEIKEAFKRLSEQLMETLAQLHKAKDVGSLILMGDNPVPIIKQVRGQIHQGRSSLYKIDCSLEDWDSIMLDLENMFSADEGEVTNEPDDESKETDDD